MISKINLAKNLHKRQFSTNNNNEGVAKITYMATIFTNGKDEIKQLLLQLFTICF